MATVLLFVVATWTQTLPDRIRAHQVALVVGPTGTGKTWLACALGQSACRQGYTVRYMRMPRLLGKELLRRSGWSYGKLLQQLAKTDLLILKDWGLAPLGDRERRNPLEIVEDRVGRRATLVTSQIAVEHWHDLVGDATFGDAILDRLVHHAHRIILPTDRCGDWRRSRSRKQISQSLILSPLVRCDHNGPKRVISFSRTR